VSRSGQSRGTAGGQPERDEGARPILDLKVEEALSLLEEIADQLEDGDLDLEHSLARFREARALYAHCIAKLTAAESEMRILMADGSTAAAAEDEDLGLEPEGGR
jgi:exodeoxyribonuclease VII small subunit